jgi:citrate synthase
MCFAVPAEEYKVDPILSRAMDRIFTLHADHEQNASTSTVRLASSSGRQPLRLHRRRHRLPLGPRPWRRQPGLPRDAARDRHARPHPRVHRRAKDKNDPFRLMGFGHRVYKNFDPRAKVMKESADEVLDLLGIENNPTLQVAKELEKVALEDPYFAEKKLYPQRGFLFRHHPRRDGLPDLHVHADLRRGRTVGWVSQWKEMIADPALKIGRPRQLYTGETMRDYVEIENR